MIGFIDNMLRHLFLSRIDELTDEAQVRFQPPDDDWVSYVTNLNVDGEPVNALNVYLCEIRENSSLRSTTRTRSTVDGVTSEMLAPRRLDCHYFISAWSPADETGAVEPTLDEHELMYETTRVLMQEGSLQPAAVYFPNLLPPGFPEAINDAYLPLSVSAGDGFTKLPEFWSSMSQPWRPGIHLIVTLPVIDVPKVLGPVVTTRIAKFRIMDSTVIFDSIIAIGGEVLDDTLLNSDGLPTPIADVPVFIFDSSGNAMQNMVTNESGKFVFGGLRNGNYQLMVRIIGRGEFTQNIFVPAPDGIYNIHVT